MFKTQQMCHLVDFQHGYVCADNKALLHTQHVQQSMTSCFAEALLLATREDMLICACLSLSRA